MKQLSAIPLDVSGAHKQIKLCYDFANSDHYYHQELSVFNPSPKRFDPAYVFPRDMLLLTHHKDYDQALMPLSDLISMGVSKKAPIHCVGSHKSDLDRTIQLIWIPANSHDSQLILQFIADVPAKEKQKIVDDLLQTCRDANVDRDSK